MKQNRYEKESKMNEETDFEVKSAMASNFWTVSLTLSAQFVGRFFVFVCWFVLLPCLLFVGSLLVLYCFVVVSAFFFVDAFCLEEACS